MLPANERTRRNGPASAFDAHAMRGRASSITGASVTTPAASMPIALPRAAAVLAAGALAAVALTLASCGSVRGTDRRLLEQNPAPTELAEDAERR
ncbi:MAG: hypothetical protein GC172_10825 [Phycisphaera sp.]|nr:hypothetical protein [Phycisphaera sp.]